MIICGFDPGTLCTGFGILQVEGQKTRHVHHGVIKPKEKELPLRLKEIFLDVANILTEYKPQEVSIETSFYANNAQTALKLGQARGVIMLAASLQDLPLFEYTPTEIKKATCSYGHADKEQISSMVEALLHLPKNSIGAKDASDALAIALCHAASRSLRRFIR